ncbi:eukaryotic translation initiation factor 3 subunit F [Colletotrichum higginsianum]|uniref:Eukaryotic translation initiation factor 3 subunit F n=1 Tax=Colletotrichum higginsianum (strain IMI 349063) TaxID=759273 RepID=H1V6X1_COLHI|nr:eukaryotic translation initiation factor 3 subunit F [Colletotrichum higginsianum]
MAVAETEKFLHLSRPIAPATIGIPGNIAPLTVNIQPQVRHLLLLDIYNTCTVHLPLRDSSSLTHLPLSPPRQAILSILDHAVRRDIRDTQSTRVIGALVGVRSEDGTEVEVRSCFAIPHTENEDQVEVDVDYQKNMLALTLKANPRESLLGWYTTTHELNSFSALIQNFFASPETGTFPHPAVHLTISTDPTSDIEARCYISAPVAVNAERAAESCLFIQVPHKLMYGDAERSALEAISMAKDTEDRTAPVVSDIEGLARSIESGARTARPCRLRH